MRVELEGLERLGCQGLRKHEVRNEIGSLTVQVPPPSRATGILAAAVASNSESTSKIPADLTAGPSRYASL